MYHVPCYAGGREMKRALVVLLFALGVSACGAPVQGGSSDEPVQLLTGDAGGYTIWNKDGVRSCFGLNVVGQIVADPKYGTAIDATPVMWPLGFTGRWVGSEVEVLDPTGSVVATTGRRYRLDGGYWGDSPRVFSACGAIQQ
jgi:hypothetical protein